MTDQPIRIRSMIRLIDIAIVVVIGLVIGFLLMTMLVGCAGCGDNEPPPLCTDLKCTPTCDENPCLHHACDCICTPEGLDQPVACLYEHTLFPH